MLGDDIDEIALEELVAVEKDIVHVPSAGCGKETAAKVSEGQFQRLGVVASDTNFLFGDMELFVRSFDLVGTVVDEPEGPNGRNGERDTVDPLDGYTRVWWVAASMVEDEKENDEDGLIE